MCDIMEKSIKGNKKCVYACKHKVTHTYLHL